MSKSRNSGNVSVKNLKANTLEKSSEVPVVEFDISTSTFENLPQTTKESNNNPQLFGRRSSLKKYLNSDALVVKNPDSSTSIIRSFTPQSEDNLASSHLGGSKSGPTNMVYPPKPKEFVPNINQQECIKKMHKIVQSHILMNSMIKWIENGFMVDAYADSSVTPDKARENL